MQKQTYAIVRRNQYDRNNAEPLANGDCCSDCNSEKVIPARMKEMGIG